MKRVVISSFITLVILGIIAVSWFYFQRYSIVTTDPVNAVPANAFFFIELPGAKDELKKLSSENLLPALSGGDTTDGNKLKFLDSLLSSNNDVKEIWEEKTIYMSAHLTKANSFDYLWLANVPSAWTDEKTDYFISEALHLKSPAGRRIYENVTVHELVLSPEKSFSFAVSKGVFMGSFTSFLIDDAIRQLKSGISVNKSKAFSKVADIPETKTDAVIYVNYIGLSEFFSSFSSGENTALFSAISSFTRWSKLNLSILHNGFSFRGLTASNDTADFISAFAAQEPQRIDVTEILPSRTALFVHLGLSRYPAFFNHLHSNSIYFDPPNKRSQLIKSLEKKFNVDFEKNLTSWIGNELALAVTEPGSASFENSSYAFIKTKNTALAETSLAELQEAINKNSGPLQPEEYRKHTLGYINLSGLVPLFYGNLFKNITRFYYTTAGLYVVVANQPAALRSFIDDYEDNKTLTEDVEFKNVSKNAERESNFYLYINFDRAKNIFHHYASDYLSGMIDRNRSILGTFSGFTFQLVNKKEKLVTTAQLLQAKVKINNANLLWAASLDTAVNNAPFLLTNAETKKKFVMVQDEYNTLYMFDDAGNTAWKKPLPEKIISGFHVVDGYKNGQQQILFNTASRLYMLDLTGTDYGNYPIHLPASATNGCVVFDFDQSKNYTIFVACQNGMIYAYEISGKPVNGWLFNQPVSHVTKPLQNFRVKEKDYLLVYNNYGTVFVLDKKGAVRTALKQTFIAKNSTFSFMPGDSLDADHLVTTDTSGKILNIYFNGTAKSKSYGSKSSDHAFAIADVDGDGTADYVFLDHHQLNVIRKDSSVVYYHIFTENMLPEIHPFSISVSRMNLGFGTQEGNKMYLLDSDGKISNGFPVKGFTGTIANDWGTDGKKMLVTSGNDATIYLYDLE